MKINLITYKPKISVVALTIFEEPDLKAAKDIHYQIQNAYVNSHVAATRIGISDNTLQRITDTVLYVEGERIDVLPEGLSKINIALQLKSKRNVSNIEITQKSCILFLTGQIDKMKIIFMNLLVNKIKLLIILQLKRI